MTITARYSDEKHTQVVVRLEPGDTFGNYHCQDSYTNAADTVVPAQEAYEFTVGMDIGNKEHDTLFPNAVRKDDGTIDQGTPSLTIQDWVAPPTPVPASIPMYRAKIILQLTKMPSDPNTTIWDATNEFVSNIPDPSKKLIAQTALNDAPDLYRNSITLAAVIAYLESKDPGITATFIDGLFVAALNLPI